MAERGSVSAVRHVRVSTALTGYLDWPGVAQAGEVERQRAEG
jgi:hypothetical protein